MKKPKFKKGQWVWYKTASRPALVKRVRNIDSTDIQPTYVIKYDKDYPYIHPCLENTLESLPEMGDILHG